MYTLLARALLGVIVQMDSPNYIWRFFCRVTDPVIAVIALATPKATAPVVLWLFSAVWMFWLRVGLLYLFLLAGAVPKQG
jgi:YggT family protein